MGNISIVCVFQGILDSGHVLIGDPNGPRQCGIFDRTFVIYSSLVSFFIPLGIMLFADLRSVQILRRHWLLQSVSSTTSNVDTTVAVRSGKWPEDCIDLDNGPPDTNNHKVTIGSYDGFKSNLGEMRERHVVGSGSQSIPCRQSTIDESSSATYMEYPAVNRLPPSDDTYLEYPSVVNSRPPARLMASNTLDEDTSSIEATQMHRCARERQRLRSRSLYHILAAHQTANKTTNSRERRAEKALIWVFVCFVVLWLPFFSVNLAFGLCRTCSIPDQVFSVFTWLGYISSGVNPCIYTLLSKDFRRAFRAILFCRCKSLSRTQSERYVSSTRPLNK